MSRLILWALSVRRGRAAGFFIGVTAAALVLGMPQAARAGAILGATAAAGVQNAPLNADPASRDDFNLASTNGITSVTTKTAIFNTSATEWNNTHDAANQYTWHLAGDAADPIGILFTQIDPSRLNVTQYNPWVTDNNGATGFATGLDGVKYNRGVTGQDAGGADIVVKYTPVAAANDPETFNFLQVIQTTYGLSERGTAPANYTHFDNGGAATPYYNDTGVSGVNNGEAGAVAGNNDQLNLNAENGFGWMLDIPYRCESGFTGTGLGCPATTALNDGLITAITSTFDLYIEADQVVDGTTYHILYGGLRWGYGYANSDVPEPSSLVLFGSGLAGLAVLRRRRRRQHRV